MMKLCYLQKQSYARLQILRPDINDPFRIINIGSVEIAQKGVYDIEHCHCDHKMSWIRLKCTSSNYL